MKTEKKPPKDLLESKDGKIYTSSEEKSVALNCETKKDCVVFKANQISK